METIIVNKLKHLEKERKSIELCQMIIQSYLKHITTQPDTKFITDGFIIEKDILCQIIDRVIKIFENKMIIVNTEIKIENEKSQEITYITIE